MNIPTKHWTVDDVYKYISTLELEGFKYGEYAEMFRKEIINGRLLLNLEKEDLNVLGIHQFSKRNALYQHIQKLKSTQSTKPLFSSSPINNNNNIAINTSESSTMIFSKLTNNSTKESTPKFTPKFTYTPNTNNMNTMNRMNGMNGMNTMNTMNIMTPLILPQPSSPINTNNTISILQSLQPQNKMNNNNINNNININNNNNNNNNNLLATFSTNSPIFGSSFPPISPNLISNPLNAPQSILNSPLPQILSPKLQKLQLNNNNNNINIKKEEKICDEKTESMKIYTSIRRIPNQFHLVEIPGIYQGVNSHKTAFILMTQETIIELNEIYKQYNILNDDNDTIKSRNIFAVLQKFHCDIETRKIQHGWLLNTVQNRSLTLPFNPLIKFKLNILSDEIINIEPIIINGHINHINNFGQAWITSDLQIDAIEEVSSIPSALISNIITLKLTNISHKSLQQREASYMIHDPEHCNDYRWKKGLKLKFCLKLSTRTNKKNNNTRKPVFIQSWNVKPM